MEESAKRRERLQAMRMEASAAPSESSSPSSTTMTRLSNPLIQPAATALESPPPPHRFDYYTDPAAAYSAGNIKTGCGGRGRDASDRGGAFLQPQNFSSPIRSASPMPYPAAQATAGRMEYHISPTNTAAAQQFLSPNESLYATQLPRSQSGSWGTPVQYPSPTPGYTPFQYLSPSAGYTGTPYNNSAPAPWNMPGSSAGRGYASNISKGVLSSSRHGDNPMSSGYSGIRGSPHSHSRGRGWQSRSGSPSPGRSSGRARGGYYNQGYCSGRQEVNLYVKSMVKDPWRKLKPVVGNILVALSGPNSWLPKSIATKRARVVEIVNDSKPKQNLAEYLALAFEDAVSNEQEGEGLVMPKPNSQDKADNNDPDGVKDEND